MGGRTAIDSIRLVGLLCLYKSKLLGSKWNGRLPTRWTNDINRVPGSRWSQEDRAGRIHCPAVDVPQLKRTKYKFDARSQVISARYVLDTWVLPPHFRPTISGSSHRTKAFLCHLLTPLKRISYGQFFFEFTVNIGTLLCCHTHTHTRRQIGFTLS